VSLTAAECGCAAWTASRLGTAGLGSPPCTAMTTDVAMRHSASLKHSACQFGRPPHGPACALPKLARFAASPRGPVDPNLHHDGPGGKCGDVNRQHWYQATRPQLCARGTGGSDELEPIGIVRAETPDTRRALSCRALSWGPMIHLHALPCGAVPGSVISQTNSTQAHKPRRAGNLPLAKSSSNVVGTGSPAATRRFRSSCISLT